MVVHVWFGSVAVGVSAAGRRLVGALAVRSEGRTSVVGLPLVVAFFGVGRLWWLQ